MNAWKCALLLWRTVSLSKNRSINIVLPDPRAEKEKGVGKG